MSFACRGLTHCSECGTLLGINRIGMCESCEEKLKKKKQNKEKINMSKTYKGYELIKEIAEGNIKKGAKFIEYKDNKEVTRSTFNGKDFEHITDRYGSYDTAWHLFNCTFELIEDEVEIDNIEELLKIEEYKNMLKTCNKVKDIDRIKAINERILELEELIEGRK